MEVLHGVSVDIADSEFVVLVGPSGCGKSTLLRMLAGLENITSGEIAIGGRVVNTVPPKDRDVAMVFQNYALYPHMTVFQNMAFSLKLAKAPKEVMDREVMRAAKILGLDQLLHRFPRQLSGGQRQRVAMGRAIVRNPQVFLFDEPLSNLDAKLRVQMRSEIKTLHQRLKVTTVYVTHDQIEAMTMADKIVVMNSGVVEQAGPPLELYDRPANMFVAGFIGSPAMNMIEGNIANGSLRTADGTAWALPGNGSGRHGGPTIYGIRPEHLRLDPDGIKASVQVVEPTGSETQVLLRVGDQSLVAAFRDRVSAKPGELLPVSPDRALIHLFDRPIWPADQLTTATGGNEQWRTSSPGEMRSASRRAARRPLALAGQAGAQVPRADVAAPKLPLENGASLRILRPARFVEPDESDVPRQHRQVPAGDRHRDARRLRWLGGYPPAVGGGLQHRHRSRYRSRLERGPARLRRQGDRAQRRGRVSRQALRRLELPRREVRQEGQAPTTGSAFPSAARTGPICLSQVGPQGGRLRQRSQRPRRGT